MEKKRLTVEVDKVLHDKAKSKAYAEGKTLKDKVIELLKGWLHAKK